MSLTLLGIIMDFKLEQPENADSSMVVTLFGIVTDVKSVQPLNTPCLIEIVPSGRRLP